MRTPLIHTMKITNSYPTKNDRQNVKKKAKIRPFKGRLNNNSEVFVDILCA
jgi:hypothetical protein